MQQSNPSVDRETSFRSLAYVIRAHGGIAGLVEAERERERKAARKRESWRDDPPPGMFTAV